MIENVMIQEEHRHLTGLANNVCVTVIMDINIFALSAERLIFGLNSCLVQI